MRKKTAGFIDRTLYTAISLLKETISHEEIASRKGFLQARDPRLKIISGLVLILSVLVAKNSLTIIALYLITITASALSNIGIGLFLKRTLLFIPIFSLFIVVPALFSAVTPGKSIVAFTIWHLNLSITEQGLDCAGIFFLRVLTSVSLSILLVLTTRHHALLKVLRIFKIPQLFVMTLGMTYRYIYLLLDIVQNTFIAIKSRVGFVASTKTGRSIVAANMAGLWLKSYRLQTQVYSAMLSRGYTGEPVVMETFRAHGPDWAVCAFALSLFIGTLWLNSFTR